MQAPADEPLADAVLPADAVAPASWMDTSLNLGAKEFVPGGAAPAPGGAPGGAPEPASGALAGAAAAPPFVPGVAPSRAPVNGSGLAAAAAPFVPGGGGSAGGGDAATPHRATLPDGDDFLGMTAHLHADGGVGRGAPGGVGGYRPPRLPYGGGPGLGPPPPTGHYGGYAGYGRGAAVPPYGGGRGAPAGVRPPFGARVLPPALGRGALRPPGPAPRSRPGAGPASSLDRARMAATAAVERLRAEAASASALALAQAADGDGLPPTLGPFHSLYPLEDPGPASTTPSSAFGVPTLVLKGVHADDGAPAALRRLDPRAAPPTADLVASAARAVAAWAPLAGHPHLAPPTHAFVASDVGGAPSLWLASPLLPGAVTLRDAHAPRGAGGGPGAAPAGEDALWSYLVQLCAALRAAHTAGLALRPACLAPSKVLLIPPARIRVGGLGVPACLAPLDARDPAALASAQRADVAAVGRLILGLACGGGPPTVEAAAAATSPDLASLAAALAAAADGGRVATWHALAAALGGRLLSELDGRAALVDALSAALTREGTHGRLLRSLARLTAVTERDDAGAEAGDAYVAKLFRDAVFHGVDADGAPALDWASVAESLSKLDAGVPERLLLLSRDEASMLVVTYGDVRRCVEGAWRDLHARAAAAARGGGAGL